LTTDVRATLAGSPAEDLGRNPSSDSFLYCGMLAYGTVGISEFLLGNNGFRTETLPVINQLELLRIFCAAAEAGSFREAARRRDAGD